MSIPTTRAQFAAFCLRQLGAPTIQINVTEEQVDDCIDRALYLYQYYHFDGHQKQYYTYAVNSNDIANRYITLPANIIGAIQLFPIGDALNTNSLFNMRYQFVINDLYNISNVSLVPYYMVMNHVQFLEEMLVGRQPIRFNRFNNICYIDMDWTTITAGEFLIVECEAIIDPATFSGIWQDRWLQDYTACLIQKVWGNILTKFADMPLPSGMKFNGTQILADARTDQGRLEKELMTRWSQPIAPFMA